ncbi:22371_t:CDS:2 [Cetraspora pellucida]|uniref:22371_t:CDS:1 n=1 Tax=Cetraspora pellucida TaxID=1433469 RepID=A0A9N8Z080_9GLOM|nr:22371_t:CDS:2 [Cetraspora pellucida]
MVSSVSRTDNNDHPDEHYCLISVKNNKAKVPLGITAVRRTFRVLQTIRKLVIVSDYNFPIGVQQKLIPLVYLIISPNDTNVMLRNSQLSIFIHPQYGVGTSSTTHMQDLDLLVKDSHLDGMLKIENKIKPIWVLLVDGGPDENPYHMKNIVK